MTSDVFNTEKKEPSTYYIKGPGIKNISFQSSLYDEQTAEAEALYRALRIGCHLYREDPDGSFFEILPLICLRNKKGQVVSFIPSRAVPAKKRDIKTSINLTLEMLNDTQYVPGIQIGTY